MSNDRRRRGSGRGSSRPRRQQRQSYEPAGPVQFTGVMGMFQRNARFFFLIGIIVMVLSLGGFVFASQLQTTGSTTTDPEPTASPEPTTSAEATPTGTPDPYAGIVRSYAAAPEMTIDPGKRYEAVIRLEGGGEVRLELLPDAAPEYVNNFVFLAENRFYDGLTFHRVVPNFVAQAGDPSGTGLNDAGYELEPETNSLAFEAGVLSMAKAGPRVSSSQFFITLGPAAHLNGEFTVFGRVIAGLDVLKALPPRDPLAGGEPGPRIQSIEIIEGSGE